LVLITVGKLECANVALKSIHLGAEVDTPNMIGTASRLMKNGLQDDEPSQNEIVNSEFRPQLESMDRVFMFVQRLSFSFQFSD
jgi:hypothetical protein